MPLLRSVSEGLARRTSRRGLVSRGWDAAFGALAGAAAGGALGAGRASAGRLTACGFPDGLPCPCETCNSNGLCAKPCLILTQYYASGCWAVLFDVTCCDCDCQGHAGFLHCGCGSDYHNNPTNCPDGTADT